MRALLWTPLAACGLILQYKNDLVLALDVYDAKLDELNVRGAPSALLTNRIGWLVLAILLLALVITFVGIAIEKYALSVFLGVFIYTLMQVFKELLNEYVPKLVTYLPESMQKHVSPDTTANIFYLTIIAIVVGIIIFILLYHLIKLVSMVILTYVLFDWIVKTHFKLPETLDLATKLAILAGVLAFYVLLRKVYSFVFAFVFASYGGLYLLAFAFHMFAKVGAFSDFLNAFYTENPIASLRTHRETLFWVVQTGIAFVIQITMI